ncbi:HEAT repeat domain-containing protein [Pendulispora rubella]|uniref:HEAT repeat domain-containing protein n=1 Tax=Pendulispora rubella TaxID=2741070 RepID=A0ABZ2L428_9BACT
MQSALRFFPRLLQRGGAAHGGRAHRRAPHDPRHQREDSLKAWANLVDNRVQPQHLQTLHALASAPGLDEETFTEVVIAATKFAEEGALPLVQQLARHPSAKVRAEVSTNLRFNAAEKFNGKRELLVQLAQDPSPGVRKGAVSALSSYVDEQGILPWLAQIADADADPEVQAESLSSLQFGHHHGMLDFTLSVYERHLQNPNAEVRKHLPQCLSFMPPEALQRVGGIVQRLAQDPDEGVRDAMAFQFCNLTEMPQLLPIAQHMAQHDPSLEVRRQALGSMSGLMQPQQAAAFYSQLFAQAKSEDDLWPIVNGLRAHAEHAEVRRLLTHMGQLPYPHLADAAREAMS